MKIEKQRKESLNWLWN